MLYLWSPFREIYDFLCKNDRSTTRGHCALNSSLRKPKFETALCPGLLWQAPDVAKGTSACVYCMWMKMSQRSYYELSSFKDKKTKRMKLLVCWHSSHFSFMPQDGTSSSFTALLPALSQLTTAFLKLDWQHCQFEKRVLLISRSLVKKLCYFSLLIFHLFMVFLENIFLLKMIAGWNNKMRTIFTTSERFSPSQSRGSFNIRKALHMSHF